MSELRNHFEGLRRRTDDFSNLVDEGCRSIAKESRALANVNDSIGMKPHQSRAGCIGGHWIIRQHDLSQTTRGAVERPVAFHRHNPVRNYEADRNGCAQIKDAFLNSPPMENVLRPSVSRTRYYAKHVLHTERDAGPVMGLYLGHGDQEIGLQHSAGEPEVFHPGVARPKGCTNQFVAIEIDESDLFIPQRLLITTL